MYRGKKVAVLNSRQQLRPSLKDEWVNKTVDAIRFVKSSQMRLLVSVGMNNWEIALALASENKIPIDLYIPKNKNKEFDSTANYYIDQFSLNRADINIIQCDSDKERDKRIVADADYIIPVSIRSEGRLDSLINQYGKIIISNFETQYQPNTKTFAYQIDESELNPDQKQISDSYLFHWTRTANEKWPDENWYDYYSSILSNDNYPRSAFDTLIHIIETKMIIASSKNIRGKQAVVSFSSEQPDGMYPMMRWRSRYHQMSFEPYAVGFQFESTDNKSILPVRYYNEDEVIDQTIDWRYQSEGKITDWRSEKEYRHLGNFDFSKLTNDNLLIITRYKKEADQIKNLTGLKTISYTNQ